MDVVLFMLLLVILGFAVGVYGTLIGAGGGFVLVPLLLLLYPEDSPTTITSVSLAVVFFNALSGTIAYARQKRVDFQAGAWFALATVPGAVVGALLVGQLRRGVFDVIFGFLLVAISTLIFVSAKPNSSPEGGFLPNGRRWGVVNRLLVDGKGVTHAYTYNRPLGIALSVVVGLVSSLLGIGGGIIHVPALVQILHFPAHIATATSHFVLAVMALAGTGVHIATGEFSTGWRRTIFLSLGVIIGAQVGARLSQRVHGTLILRLLALALAVVGLRLIAAVVL